MVIYLGSPKYYAVPYISEYSEAQIDSQAYRRGSQQISETKYH